MAKSLVKELSFELRANQSLMIMGPSGTGKSSVLRTIAGLWPGGGGLARTPRGRPSDVPSRSAPTWWRAACATNCSIPIPTAECRDEEIRKVVADVNLSDVFARVDDDLDRVVDWSNVLSLGEQQRIAFARLFLRKPQVRVPRRSHQRARRGEPGGSLSADQGVRHRLHQRGPPHDLDPVSRPAAHVGSLRVMED